MELTFLSVQATYAHVQIALFRKDICIDIISEQDARASSHLIPYFDKILKRNSLGIEDLNFIAIDRGPGAFTSLRTAVATINGIGLTHKVSVLGIDSLNALMRDVVQSVKAQSLAAQSATIVTLLNAYNNDVYFAIAKTEAKPVSGYKKIDALLADLKADSVQKFIFAGNGASLHKELIANTLGSKNIHHLDQETATAQSIAFLALERYQQGDTSCYRIEPNYVKSQYFAIQKPFNVPQI